MLAKRFKGYSLIWIALVVFCASLHAEESKVPFADYADAFAEAAGHADIERNDEAFLTVLNDSYVTTRLGVFDLWYPRGMLRESARGKQLQTAALVLLELQEKWLGWVADDAVLGEAFDDVKVLKKWVKSWKTKKIHRKKDDETGTPDLLNLLKAKDEQKEAAARFEAFMRKADFMTIKPARVANVFIIIAPTRKNYLEMGCFLGSLNETNRGLLWQDRMALWTTFNCGYYHAIALQYPGTNPGNGDITQGVDLTVNSKTGPHQQVLMHSAVHMINYYYGRRFTQEMVKGFAMNLLIDTYKEFHLRTGGSKGKKLAGYSVFVAGGNSSGGTLPGRKARPDESRWKKDKGKDYFVDVLRKANKLGAKKASKQKLKADKKTCFLLVSDKGVSEYVARAPFLMRIPNKEKVPGDYKADYKEFMGAYSCAFAYWLREKAESVAEKDKPAGLLKRYLGKAVRDKEGTAEQKVYGMPMSAEDPAADSLESRFLDWLIR